QDQHLQVADGVDQHQVGHGLEAAGGERGSRAGVDRKHDSAAGVGDAAKDCLQARGVVDVCCPVHRQEDVATRLQSELGQHPPRFTSDLEILLEGVVHDVADHPHTCGDALASEVGD